jgi:hypothetical protein
MRETACQQERHDTAASAEIDERVSSSGRHKVCEEESFQGKVIAVWSLVER